MNTSWFAKIEQWPTGKLSYYANNARLHSEDQISQIAASIAQFGFTNPILAGSDGVIVAGHGRLAAAQKLCLTSVPVVILDHLTDAQRRALVIADNKIAENATWDSDLLKIELAALKDVFDLSLLGFDPDELYEIMEEPQGQCEEDLIPPHHGPVISKLGDLWDMGKHKLLCGDATNPDSYIRLLDNAQANMCFTDPPYNVNYGNSARDKLRGKCRAILNDNLGEGFYDFLLAAFTPMLSRCKGAVYVCMSSSELDTLQAAFRTAGGHFSTYVIWAKNTFTVGRSDYQRQFEPILYGWREGSRRFWCGDRDQGDVWDCNKPTRSDLHPNMKPIALIERAILNSSRAGDSVLDAFGGSGSTLIASEKTARQAYLMELDPRYADVIVRRWQDYTGKEATRVSDGATFNALFDQASLTSSSRVASSVVSSMISQ